jgi:hypothetical protein
VAWIHPRFQNSNQKVPVGIEIRKWRRQEKGEKNKKNVKNETLNVMSCSFLYTEF